MKDYAAFIGPSVVVAAVAASEYLALLVAVLLDFRAGLRKARQRGEKATSRGFRRTVSKAASYFSALLSLSLMDVPLVVTMLYMRVAMQWSLPCFPLFTTVGALAMIMIEGKSIRESALDKRDISTVVQTLRELVGDNLQLDRLASMLDASPSKSDSSQSHESTNEKNVR